MRITHCSIPAIALSLSFSLAQATSFAAEDPTLGAAGPPPPAAAPAVSAASSPTSAAPTNTAQASTPPNDQARALFEEGVKYYNEENYEKAHASFLEAYKLKPHPAVLLNVAQSALLAGKFAEAANQFAQYLADTKDDAKQAPEAKTGFEEAKAKSLGVTITVDMSDAALSADGVDIGKSPRRDPYFLDPGPHKISASKAGKSADAQVDGKAGDMVPATLSIATSSPATGSQEQSSALLEEQSGRKPFAKWFAQTPLAWVGAGISGLGLGGSLIFSLVSSGRYSAADDTKSKILNGRDNDGLPSNAAPCGPPALDQRPGFNGQTNYSKLCSQYVDQRDSGDSFKTVSIVSLVVGVVAGGGTVAYYFLDPNAKESNSPPETGSRSTPRLHAQLVPISTSTTQGLSVVGTF